MNGLSTNVGIFRPRRKCFSISGSFSLLLVLFLLVSQAAARPAEEEEEELHQQPNGEKLIDDGAPFEVMNDEYADVDNVEFHHVKIVDGVMHEDHHPVIMYKEDFVNEDYVPIKNRTHDDSTDSSSASSRPSRKYKDIAHRRRRLNHTQSSISTEQYHALKPEKIYFDVLPQAPVVVADDSSANDSKFDSSKIRVEVISLTEEENNKDETSASSEEPSKQELHKKHPKKYHKRIRRNAEEQEHVIRKRNPRYQNRQSEVNSVSSLLQQAFYRTFGVGPPVQYIKHPVTGVKWNGINGQVPSKTDPISIGNRIGGDDNEVIDNGPLIWGRRPQTDSVGPSVTRRPAPPLIHDVNDENVDYSFMNNRRPTTSATPATPTRRPAPPLIHDVNDENIDFSFMTRPPPARAPATQRPRATTRAPQTAASVSNCVWAIVQCCSARDYDIRYSCFEANGCSGAFWGLNPCADNIRDNVVNSLGELYD